ncbi:serine/threonine-protein kinase [Streptomyces sp. NPDC014889]|uniref:serine/threonine-protein kinase n=1 Tax=Streptomyces sp. NPDC014889 TaxID=3364928 RepID=UPI0036F9627D
MLIAGRYRLHDPIGRGAMGEVWRGSDETLGRPVAVKLLLAQESDPTAATRFRLEAQTAGRLNHPHVVSVLDFGEQEGRLFMVMELVDSDSLAGLLSTTAPLPAERVARIAAQAAAGLAAAHQQSIVHRDIKPANLLMDADGTLKIGDFGIARFLDDPAGALTATGHIIGTSLYLAPERALGKPAVPASDMYSLGCVLYQLLTGRPPFQADTAIAILHQHLDATPVPPREFGVVLPPAFENYLLGLLAKQPEDRPTAQQMADWFAAGAWQGHPEPLPSPLPAPVASFVQDSPLPEPGPATTYVLPSATVHAGVRGRRDRRQWAGEVRRFVGRPPRLLGTLAAALVFLAAMLLGMTLFSPERSSADIPQADPTARTTSPAPAPPHSSPEPSTAPATSATPEPPPSTDEDQDEND